MNNETKKTEQLIQIYKEDPVKENLNALIHQVRKTVFLVPGILPDTPEAEEFRKKAKESAGQQLQLPKEAMPLPSILKNPQGATFLPVYTTAEQIPKEPKFDVIMNMPFMTCCASALGKLGTQGIAMNPFSDNLLFQKEVLEAILKDSSSAAPNPDPSKMSPKQRQIMMRQRAEFHDFPFRAYKEGAEFIHKLSDEKEALVSEIYKNAYQDPEVCPYGEGDFSVMPLNINEELLLVRVDLPEVKENAQLCYRLYLTLNPQTEQIHYFTVERGKKKDERNLCGVSPEGKHLEYGEAPVEGAEMQRIIDILKEDKGRTS